MAINLKPVDVIVIGLGAAGGVAVLPLARAGLKVAGIEAGTWMDPHQFRPDELHNNVRGLLTSVPKANQEIPTVRENDRQKARPGGRIHPMMNAIGGTSIHYWAQSWRLKEFDFRTRSETVRRYGAGAIPQGATVEDWPLTYDELEPYYDTIEYELGVSGKAGNIAGVIDPRGNVFEAARRREYPMPPLRGSGFSDLMMKAAKELGWKAYVPPAAINSQPFKGRPGCAYHGYCSRGGCHIGAKNSTAVTTIPEAMKTKNLTIFDKAHVRRIETAPDGKAAGVTYIRDGKEYFQPARVVMAGGYTYENSRLLLLSKSKAYPRGLSNNHGQVGRHYFGHWANGSVAGLFPFDLNVWYGTPAQGVAVDEWSDDHFDHAGLGFIGGTNLHVHTEMHPIEAANMPTYGKAPEWGAGWKAFVQNNAARWTASYLQTSSLPYEHTWLDLDPDVRDPLGDPVCRITQGPKENELRAARHAEDRMEEWFKAAGATAVRKGIFNGPGVTTHAYGGTRMGDSPESNVVNRWGFSHEAPNLAMLGASVMGTSGSRNPTETVQALAWRTAEWCAKNWKTLV